MKHSVQPTRRRLLPPLAGIVLPVLVSVASMASAGHAQTAVFGYVIDASSERPIAEVLVVLKDAAGRELARQRTDRVGRYGFEELGTNRVRLEATRRGYHAAESHTIELDVGARQRVDFHLDVDPIDLPAVDVTADGGAGSGSGLAGFERRRANGGGWFLTRDEIELRAPARVTDLLRMAPGVELVPAAGGGPTVRMRRSNSCPALVYIDGLLVNRPAPGGSPIAPVAIDELIGPESIAGIEVYQGLSRVPMEYLTTDAPCGVVGIWTRDH